MAILWSIPIVNHTWLEDCFVSWRNLSVGHEKFVRFSSTCNFSGLLGSKGMGRKVILDDAGLDAPTRDLGTPTASTAEVEEVATDDNDFGTSSQRPRVKAGAEDVVMADTGADVPLRNGGSPIKLGKPTSYKSLVSKSPISTKETRSVKAKISARKSVPAINREEEEEPASTKGAPPKKTQKRKRHESESEEEEELSEEPTPGPSKLKSTRRPAQESSPAPEHADDAPVHGRRSAAQKADERLKGIMPDMINFQKQMKRGMVAGEWEKAENEQERVEKTKEKEREKLKENAREKVKETTKRRRSDMRYEAPEHSVFKPTQSLLFHSTKGEGEDSSNEPSTSRGNVHIMTTKINVSEDTKKVQTILRSQRSKPHVVSTLTTAFRL